MRSALLSYLHGDNILYGVLSVMRGVCNNSITGDETILRLEHICRDNFIITVVDFRTFIYDNTEVGSERSSKCCPYLLKNSIKSRSYC